MSSRSTHLERWEYGDPIDVAIRRQSCELARIQRKRADDARELDRMRTNQPLNKRVSHDRATDDQ